MTLVYSSLSILGEITLDPTSERDRKTWHTLVLVGFKKCM